MGVKRVKFIVITLLIFAGPVFLVAVFLAVKNLQYLGQKARQTEIFQAEGEQVACFVEINVLEPPTYGKCDAELCKQVACANPRGCPANECTNDEACKEAPPAKKYKVCESEACVEKICSDPNNCPVNSCSTDTNCKNKVESKDPVCKEILANPKKGTADLKVRFSVDAEGDNLETYQFEFDDGESMDSPNDTVYHTYKKGGNFTASVKIVDSEGRRTERDDCTVKVKVEEETHMECRSEACIEVEGAEADTCANSLQCQTGAVTHLECRQSSCVMVSGSGSSICAVDKDCIKEPVAQVPVTGTNTTAIIAGLSSLFLIILGIVAVAI